MIRAIFLLILVLAPPPWAWAGVWRGSIQLEPYLIVHPPGYDGVTGGELQVRVCASDAILLPAIRAGVRLWNNLDPSVENCKSNCRLIEDSEASNPSQHDMASVVAHELGHCVFALDHINWQDGSSFTASKEANSIAEGVDGIRGSKDDVVSPLPGARIVHWFRAFDNDPFVIDQTIIDSSTFSRRILDLPLGSSWPASANRGVGEALGLGAETQSLMYSLLPRGIVYTGLVADDVNTVVFGMTGVDEVASTPDDYSVSLSLVNDCFFAEVEIRYVDLGDPDLLGECRSAINSIQQGGGLDIHHALVPEDGESRLVININSTVDWSLVFSSGFESGSLAGWSGATF